MLVRMLFRLGWIVQVTLAGGSQRCCIAFGTLIGYKVTAGRASVGERALLREPSEAIFLLLLCRYKTQPIDLA